MSVLGCALPEKDDHNAPGARDIADRLIGLLLGSMLLYWYHFSTQWQAHRRGNRRRFRGGTSCTCCGEKPSELWVKAMHTSLNLYAEHEFNAPPSPPPRHRRHGLDMYSAITGAIGRCAATPLARRRQRSGV